MSDNEADSINPQSAHSRLAAKLFVLCCLIGFVIGILSYYDYGVQNTLILIAATSQFWVPLLFSAYAVGNRGVSPKFLGVFVIAQLAALIIGWIASGR
jgi:hypothetical protein